MSFGDWLVLIFDWIFVGVVGSVQGLEGDGLGHKLVDEFMDAGLTTEVLDTRADTIARGPAAEAQFACFFVSYEPVIGLFFLCAADIA